MLIIMLVPWMVGGSKRQKGELQGHEGGKATDRLNWRQTSGVRWRQD